MRWPLHSARSAAPSVLLGLGALLCALDVGAEPASREMPNRGGSANTSAAPRVPAELPAPVERAVPQDPTTPTAAELDEARQHFETALVRYSQGRYREAIEQLQRARALDPAGKDLVYNLALVHEKLGDLEHSLEYFRQYLQMESDPEERARTQASIVRLEGALEQREPEREPEPIRAERSEPPVSEAKPPGRLDDWVLVSGGVAVATLVVGAALGASALVKSPGREERTGGRRTARETRAAAVTAHKLATAADVAFAISLTSGVAAGVLYFGRKPLPAGHEALAAVPATLGLVGGVSF